MKDDITENIILFIIAFLGFFYYKYYNPNQIIDRYYKVNSKTEYYLIKYNLLFLKLMIILNFKYIVIFILKKI